MVNVGLRLPSSSPASAMKGLNVEPGGYIPCRARLFNMECSLNRGNGEGCAGQSDQSSGGVMLNGSAGARYAGKVLW